MVLYGQVLMQDDVTAVMLMSEQLAGHGKAFLAALGLPLLPDGVDIKPLLEYGIVQAMGLCASTFAVEVAATAEFVTEQLRAHGISY